MLLKYCSWTLKAAEQSYNKVHHVFLTVVCAVLFLRSYLDRHKFSVCSYHDALRWMLHHAGATGKLNWCSHRLLKFEFHFMHRVDIKKDASDSLLQLEICGTDTIVLNNHLPEMMVSLVK